MSEARARGDYLDLAPVARAAGTVRLPGSKSISNRTLLLAALAAGATDVIDLLESDDTARMLDALTALGVRWERRAAGDYRVHGTGGALPAHLAGAAAVRAGGGDCRIGSGLGQVPARPARAGRGRGV